MKESFKDCAAHLSSFWRWETTTKYWWDRRATFLTEVSKGIRWAGGKTLGTPATEEVPDWPCSDGFTLRSQVKI